MPPAEGVQVSTATTGFSGSADASRAISLFANGPPPTVRWTGSKLKPASPDGVFMRSPPTWDVT